MSNFKMKLARFFYGRYGADELYRFLFLAELILLVAGAICNVLGRVAPVFAVVGAVLYLLALAAFAWSIFRILSKNTTARRRENQWFLRAKRKVLHPIKSHRAGRPNDTATHVFRNCPKCRSVLRLPRTTGKHTVRCPRCEHRFTVRIRK